TEQQAKLYPNPAGSVQIENFGGAGPASGFSATETTVGVSQLIELGGKREARQGIALAGRKTAEVDAAAAKLDLAKDVTVAYSQAVAAQDGVNIAVETEAAAKQVLADVNRRVAAARDPLFQRSKAEVAYSSSVTARQVAELERTAALQRLGRFWGAQTVTQRLTDLNVAQVDQPEPLAAYEARYRSAPDFLHFQRLSEMRAAELRLAEANAVPDITASTGVRQTAGVGGVTFLAGLSVPIPILNQNQGEIARAQAEFRKVDQDRRQWEIERSQELIVAWTGWQSAWREVNSIRGQSLPQAENAYQQALEGYRSGAFEYLEVLDAQRSFFEQRKNYIAALARLQTARAETERLAPSDETGSEQ
ncbi:MAG: TolC family protein, partial [Alphaproteobacteria bacterium]|nr:TolC family protein [Alphaproteobacteria bacterium]